MRSELEKLQARGQRVQQELDRITLRREKLLRRVLKDAATVTGCNRLIARLLKRRDRVRDAVGELLRAEKRTNRRSPAHQAGPGPDGPKPIEAPGRVQPD